MTRRFSVFLVAALLTLTASAAAASPYYNENIFASGIYDRTVCGQPSSTFIYISTSDLQQALLYAPDTFLVVETDLGTYYNDNYYGLASLVQAMSANGCFHIMVFASYWLDAGTADITVNGTVVDNDVFFGGTLVRLTHIDPDHYSLHTAHTPAGASRTDLYLFDDQWHLSAYDDGNGDGAGQQATLFDQDLDTGDVVLVAGDPGAGGSADLLINRCVYDPDRSPTQDRCYGLGYDYDGDYLADSLEQQLGTSMYDFNTDDDALFDYYEVIGRFEGSQTVYQSQTYSSIGANPRRRDIFLEFDRQTGAVAPSESKIAAMQTTYSDLPSIHNDDGTTGVRLHADIGIPCSDPDLCGDWGGVDSDLTYDWEESYGTAYARIKADGHFFEMRWGIFQYAYLTAGGRGHATEAPGASFQIKATRDGIAFSHELGHDLGLMHWGDVLTPTQEEMNFKVSYPSVMNYARAFTGEFSSGLMSAIDHTNVSEASYSPGVNKDYLLFSPFSLSVNGDAVDFNDDHRTGVPGNVYGHITFDVSTAANDFGPAEITEETGKGWPEFYQVQPISYLAPQGGSALIVEPGGTETTAWAFTPYEGSVSPYISIRTVTVDALDPYGVPSWQWRGDMTELLAPDGEVAGVWFPVASTEMVIVYPYDNGHLYYHFVDTASPLSGTSLAIPGWPAGVVAKTASVTVYNGTLVVVFQDIAATDPQQDNVYIATMGSTGTWTAPVLLQGINSSLTPGIAAAQDGELYMLVPGRGVGRQDADFYYKASGTLGSGSGWAMASWNSSSLETGFVGDNEKTRMNLVAVDYLDSNKQPFSDGSGYLAAFWSRGGLSGGYSQPRHAFTTGYFAPAASDPGLPKGWRSHLYQRVRPAASQSMAVAAFGGHVMRLFAATSDWDAVEGVDSLWFSPYAGGIAPVQIGDHSDNDDGDDIATYLCESSWRLVYGDDARCYCQLNNPDAPYCSASAMVMTEACP